MRGTIIFIIVVAWIVCMAFFFRQFVSKIMGRSTHENPIQSTTLLQEQKEKARQAREDQKRRMEAIRRKIRDQQRRY